MEQHAVNETSTSSIARPLDIAVTSELATATPDKGESVEKDTDHSEKFEVEETDNVHEEDAFLMEPILGEPSEEDWITMDQAMERLGYGMFQNKILVASGCCFAADAMQVLMLSFLSLVLKAEWELSSGKAQAITSCLFAGALLGTLILGPAADRVGRRPVSLCSASIITCFGFLSSLAANYWTLMILLFGVGFGIGGLVVPFDVFAEFLPSEGRGKLLLAIQYFWTLGCIFVVGAAYATLQKGSTTEESTGNWRVFVAICTVPCLISIIISFVCVPESARWLSSQGRNGEALKVLRDAATANGHSDPYTMFPRSTRINQEESHKNTSFYELFKPAWREKMMRIWGAWLGFAFGYYGVILATTRVFERHAPSADEGKLSYDFDYNAIFVSSCAELVGTTLVILLVDEVGRVVTQVVCYFLAGICVCMLCFTSASHSTRSVLILLGFAARVFEMGATCVTWTHTAEILTTDVRTTGHATANAMARIGAFFCPFLVEGDTPMTNVGLIMLLIHCFTAFCISKLPETRGIELGVVVENQNGDTESSEVQSHGHRE